MVISYRIPRLDKSWLNKDAKHEWRATESLLYTRPWARLSKARYKVTSTYTSHPGFLAVTSLIVLVLIDLISFSRDAFFKYHVKSSCFHVISCHTNLCSCIRHLRNQGCRRILEVQHLPGKTRFDRKVVNSLVQQLRKKKRKKDD